MNPRLNPQFRHVALTGKYLSSHAPAAIAASRATLDGIAHFLMKQGCEVVLEVDTATKLGLTGYSAMDIEAIGLAHRHGARSRRSRVQASNQLRCHGMTSARRWPALQKGSSRASACASASVFVRTMMSPAA